MFFFSQSLPAPLLKNFSCCLVDDMSGKNSWCLSSNGPRSFVDGVAFEPLLCSSILLLKSDVMPIYNVCHLLNFLKHRRNIDSFDYKDRLPCQKRASLPLELHPPWSPLALPSAGKPLAGTPEYTGTREYNSKIGPKLQSLRGTIGSCIYEFMLWQMQSGRKSSRKAIFCSIFRSKSRQKITWQIEGS